jgi:hypothetical protein
MQSTRYSCQILMKEILSMIFENYSTVKLHENPSSGADYFNADGRTDGRTDGHDEASSRFL